MTTSPNKLIDGSGSGSSTSNSNSNHSTPFQIHAFPSTQGTPAATSHFSSLSTTIEHASPTKALFHSRLNNDITSLTAWLEALHAPDPLPRRFLAWRDEVQQQSSLLSQLHVGVAHDGASFSSYSSTAASVDDGSKILEALKALKQANLLADHLRAMVHEARVEELAVLEGRVNEVVQQGGGLEEVEAPPPAVGRGFIDDLYTSLEPEAKLALDALAEAAVLLQVFPGAVSQGNGGCEHSVEGEVVSAPSDLVDRFSRQILKCAQHRLVLDDEVERLCVLGRAMISLPGGVPAMRILTSSTKLLKENGVEAFHAADTSDMNAHFKNEQLHAETVNFIRDAKQINLKVLEYQERVAGLQRNLSKLRAETVRIEDVLHARKQVEQRAASVRELEQRLKVFHGLPPDLAASRVEIKRAALDLEEVKRKREDLFGRISSMER